MSNRLEIEYGVTPNVLMIGNGFNRAYGFDSWDGLLKSIKGKDLTEEEKNALKNVPYPLQPVILTEDHIGSWMKTIAPELTELRAPEEEEKLLRRYAALPFHAILTTNYTYELERALVPEFKCTVGRSCKWRKVAYDQAGAYETRLLHTCYLSSNYPSIWHIHGEASRPDTMVLGHYFYGKLLAKVQQYIHGLKIRYHSAMKRQTEMECRSWVDYFMLGNVYIVGQGMALSEHDLWWLVNCKKRHFPETEVYLYKSGIKIEERLLAEAYGVKIQECSSASDYKLRYREIYKQLEKELAG